VWLGDLNYRLEESREAVDALLAPADESARQSPSWAGEASHWDEQRAALLKLDQLTRQMEEQNVFAGFVEPPIGFRPTYKFERNDADDAYDASAKQRVPSYTDRILYRCRDERAVELLKYCSCSEVRTSDHKPVTAEMRLMYTPGPPGKPNSKSSPKSSVCSVM